jgi:hypothetical protein
LDRASAAHLSSIRLALVLLDAPANVGLGCSPPCGRFGQGHSPRGRSSTGLGNGTSTKSRGKSSIARASAAPTRDITANGSAWAGSEGLRNLR